MRLLSIAVLFAFLCLACAAQNPAPADNSKPIYLGRKIIFYDKGYFINDMEEGENHK
jgi:hypothetical protein